MRNLNQTAFIICLAALLASCKNHRPAESQHEYAVIALSPTSVELEEYYSASIRGQQDIAIYPQVSGTITQLRVKEGQQVKNGEVLFVIDQIPYEAALQTAEANARAAQTQVETAKLDYNSKQALLAENVISDYELSVAKNNLAVAQASLAQAQAKVTDARNSLSYTEIKSPSNGVVGTLPYRKGALVGPSIPQPLTTVSDNSKMFIYFSMTENQIRTFIWQFGSPEEMIKQMPGIKLQLNDGSLYNQSGNVESISGIIDSQTGSISLRSVFPNEQKVLFSGGIGNVVIPHKLDSVLVIPQTATYELQDKVFVYVVKNGKAVSTQIQVKKLNDGNSYVVNSGLNTGDVIVTEGVGMLTEGAEIATSKPDLKSIN